MKLLIVILYFIGIIVIGIHSSKKNKTSKGFAIGGRKLNAVTTALGAADITDIDWNITAFDKSEGGTLSVKVVFNEAVDVTGTPQLTVVNSVNSNHTLSYASGTGTNELTFTLAIAAANAATDADDVLSIGANAVALNGGTIKDKGTATASTITSVAGIGTAAGTITVVA